MTSIFVYGAALRRVSADGCYAMLDRAEKQRANAIGNCIAREEFIKARALLRFVLANYANKPPHDFRFVTGENGKPYLADEHALEFNVSHSGGMVLIAVARCAVGIDIERADDTIDQLGVAATVFSSAERAVLRNASTAERADVFLSLWTRKEAYLKATGRGFSSNLELISSVSPDGKIMDRSQSLPARPWYVFDLPAPRNFKAALVAQAKIVDLSLANISRILPKSLRAPDLPTPNVAALSVQHPDGHYSLEAGSP